MHNRQMTRPLDLSFQDRYIMAFESELIAFNSHLILELDGESDELKIIEAFKKLLMLEPLARLVPDFTSGRFLLKEFGSVQAEGQVYLLEKGDVESFLDRRFEFPKEYALRLGLVSNEGKIEKVIFSFHHSVFDGHAQFNVLKDFLDIYTGKNYQPRTLDDVYKFRKYFSKTSPLWLLKLFFEFWKISSKKKSVKIARLFDFEPESRKVDMVLIELDRKIMDTNARGQRLSSSAYISLVGARAMHRLLKERGESERPIVLYITKSMRFEFKIMRAYQNLLGFIWMKILRDDLEKEDFAQKFRDTYKFRSGEGEVKKTLLLAGIIVKLKSFMELKKLLAVKEKKVHDCTLLISSGRTPGDMEFPTEWQIKKLYAVGSMHKSPGIGLLVTSFKQKDFICIEYLREAFKESTIERFRELILEELV